MTRATFVQEISVVDPAVCAEVRMAVFRHETGGMFAIDSSYLEQLFEDDAECIISDPFYDTGPGAQALPWNVKLEGV